MKLHPELVRMSVADMQECFLLPAPDLDLNDDPDLYRSFFYDSAAIKLERRGARQFLLATLPTADTPRVYAILSALNLYDLDAHANGSTGFNEHWPASKGTTRRTSSPGSAHAEH